MSTTADKPLPPTAPPEIADEVVDVIPPKIFPIPCGPIGYDLAARHIFASVSGKHRLFIRGSTVHEVVDDGGKKALAPISPDRFCSVLETFGPRIARREVQKDDKGGKRITWRSQVMPKTAAQIILQSDAAREHLPQVRQICSCSIIARDPAARLGYSLLGKGYHAHAGGTYIDTRASRARVGPAPNAREAAAALLRLLADFDFPTPGDRARAAASLISPALKMGGWIQDDFPLDIGEADQSQSGKTYRHKVVCAIYNEVPSAITQSTGGVGSLDEKVSSALIAGRPFIMLDNFRGRMDSQILESAIRGLGRVTARALRYAADVDCTPFLWQLSTNGAELTRDLANRSVITRIRKRAEGYRFATYHEGDLLAHIRANQEFFLGCVFSMITEWVLAGRPRTNESRHDFRGWCQTLDYFTRELFEAGPLLDGHREEQLRTANPNMQWLREIINAILGDGYSGHGFTAQDLANLAESEGIAFPGAPTSRKDPALRVGTIMGRLFRDADGDGITVDGHKFCRQSSMERDSHGNVKERKVYFIERGGSTQSTPSTQ